MMHATFDNWIRHESTPFSADSSETFNASIDRVIASLDDSVELLGIGHGFGRLEANRELVVWMRRYNADPTHMVKHRFYGFDIPGLAA